MPIARNQVSGTTLQSTSQNHIIVWICFDNLKLDSVARHRRGLSQVSNPLAYLRRALSMLFAQARAIQHLFCFVKQSGREHSLKAPFSPSREDLRRVTMWIDEGAHQLIGIEDGPFH
jgi:hypothetical protein